MVAQAFKHRHWGVEAGTKAVLASEFEATLSQKINKKIIYILGLNKRLF